LPALAGPPAPIIFTLTQPDGVTTFQARVWGDEYLHGPETVAGYTVQQDPITNIWFYAEVDSTTGQLRLTNKVVGQDPPPAAAIWPSRSRWAGTETIKPGMVVAIDPMLRVNLSKAMSSLEKGQGLILVLVTLQ